MKVGMNLLLWTAVVTDEHMDTLENIKKWGADGVEIPIFDVEGSPWDDLAKKIQDLELGCTAVTVLPEGVNLIDETPGHRQGAVEHIKRALDVCKTLDADVLCGPVCAPVGYLPGRGPTEQEIVWAAEGLREAGQHAESLGIPLAVEPLNRFETYIINTQEQTIDLLKQVDVSAVTSLYDTFHANIEEKDITKAVETGGGRIQHVHISACDRGTPGDDKVDYATTFKALKSIDYDRWLTIESFSDRLPELAGATCIWRQVSPSNEHVVKNGVKFIHEAWDKA